MVPVEVSGVPVQAGAAPAGTPTVVVDGAVVQAATPLAITPAVALEDVGLQAANAVASTGANSVGPMTRSAEQAIDEAQVRLGEASARMGDEHPNFVACLAGVLTFATCGVAWIATCFIWGDAAPGVKIECEPCGGTGFVVRKRRIFVPSNQGMERPQRSIWGPYGT